jgi:hypothetical protein
VPGARAAITQAAPPGGVLVGLDERTAMVGDGTSWTVHGAAGIHVLRGGDWTSFADRSRFELSLV